MTPLELVAYYQNLLIIQYHGKPKATGHIAALASMAILAQTSVQTISFSVAPSSGAFTLRWNGISSPSISFGDSASTIQTKLRTITGLSAVTVTGSIASRLLTVTFTSVPPPAALFSVSVNTLSPATAITVAETDITLPLAVQGAFNLLGSSPAIGSQLDIIGDYAGVSRTGAGLYGTITLGDSDFLSLIKIAIHRNSLTSDLASIVDLIYQYFPNEMYVWDHADMTMDYLISSSVGSQDLVQLFVTEGLLPKPMGVGIRAVIYYPVVGTFFSFRTYTNPASPPTATGFNNYTTYSLLSPWLSYAMNV